MRTNEERVRLIRRRTAERKAEARRKKQHLISGACLAACLLLVTGIGALMPGLTKGLTEEPVRHASGTASLIGSHEAVGYILMGLLAFLLGVCVTVLLYRLRRREERRHREDTNAEL